MTKDRSGLLPEETVKAIGGDSPMALFDAQFKVVWAGENCPSWEKLAFLTQQPALGQMLLGEGSAVMPWGDELLRLRKAPPPYEHFFVLEAQPSFSEEPVQDLLKVFERNYRAELSDIFSAVGLLRTVLRENPAQAAYLEIIDRSAMMLFRSAKVFSQYMSLSKGAWDKKTEILDLGAETADILIRLAPDFEDCGAVLHWEPPAKPMYISADRELLGLILGHLLSNALGQGKSRCEITVTLEQQQQDVVLCVQDNGKGVPENVQEGLFHPQPKLALEQDLRRANGLGLAVVKLAAEQCGGSVLSCSGGDMGTAVQVRFPLQDKPETELNRLSQQYPENPSRFDSSRLLTLDGVYRQKELHEEDGVL